MHSASAVFRHYLDTLTSASTRARAGECTVTLLNDENEFVTATVLNPIGLRFHAAIRYTDSRVTASECSCDFRRGPVCEHVAALLMHLLQTNPEKHAHKQRSAYTLPKPFRSLSLSDLFRHSSDLGFAKLNSTRRHLLVLKATENHIELDVSSLSQLGNRVIIRQQTDTLLLECNCESTSEKLCEHQTFALNYLLEADQLRLFFDEEQRHHFLRGQAAVYGMEHEEHPERLFTLSWKDNRVVAAPIHALLPLDARARQLLREQLLPKAFSPDTLLKKEPANDRILVIGSATYTEAPTLKLATATRSREGKLKNPVRVLNAADELLKTEETSYLRFFAALTRFQSEYRTIPTVTDMDPDTFAEEMRGIKAVLNNPAGYPVFRHEATTSANYTAATLQPVAIDPHGVALSLEVEQTGSFYAITGTVEAFGTQIPSERLKLVARYFIHYGDQLTLVDHYDVLRTLAFLKKNNHKIVIHHGRFTEFRSTFLDPLEARIAIRYRFVKPAPLKLVQQEGLNTIRERLIYLTDSEHFVLITPVIRYGETEIPVRSSRKLYALDQTGETYLIDRDTGAEQDLLHHITKTHPDFAEQENEAFFYLHKQEFLHNGWFIEAFEYWHEHAITVLGFNELRNNRYNPNRMKVRLRVNSEMDWFDTHVAITFGHQSVTLKQIQKSINNRSRYVQLGDGTLGLLPEEWIDRFGLFFRTGELHEDNSLRIPKSLYSQIDRLFEAEVLSQEVRNELANYREKAARFEQIEPVSPPVTLKTTLRSYQQEGLNWLYFLDNFGFGGCLADDMGLGKTIQVLAFILKQREENGMQTHLIVVPTSLLFNWIAETERFAPSLRIRTIHGASRVRNCNDFDNYDIVLTTYGTLLSDCVFLKKYRFRAIFLDESQAVKNPESKRYKAVRLLQGQFRVVLTGTPIENNTFDLYAQLSFAVPGLLGSPKQFNEHFAQPIDKFKDSQRAKELQQRIHLFLLRRTKQQVARELPEKTEMVIYCEMGAEQRLIYDTYKTEFQRYLAGMHEEDFAHSSMHILAGLTKLRQICNSPALLADQAYYGDESAKMTELLEQIDNHSAQHKILIFSQFVSMLELIRTALDQRGIRYSYLTGKTRNREEQVEQFQNNPEIRVFLISLKAGGVGLNLTAADYVYIVDPWWNPAAENQAIDRCYRIGQQKKVVAVRLICPNTIEEKILKLQENKRELANDLIKTDAGILKALSRNDLLSLL